jgi:pyridoxamine 5'-phosphate oxidase
MSTLHNYRKEYIKGNLSRNNLKDNPFEQFEKWFIEAQQSKVEEPNAMILSTSGQNNRPSSRVVLLKDFSLNGFTFFTNYGSKKGKQLNENPYASLLFAWHQMERQVRIEGKVEKLDPVESDAYFDARPEGSKLAAWASPQSKEITSREFLETKKEEISHVFQNKPITRPGFWGGFILVPDLIEFWQGRENRLHDRFEYFIENKTWRIRRLAP